MSAQGGRSGRRDEEEGEGEAPPALGGRALRGWRQLRCGGCGLPEAVCVCATLPRLPVRTRVAVVMHRIEAVRSTNTGRLVRAMLEGASVRVRGGREDHAAEVPAGRRIVLFPREDARPLTRDDAGDDLTLVVPDGTWAQARRIARRDPLAQGAEAVSLPEATSAYGLRRNPRPDALCTLEAVIEALRVLEPETDLSAMEAAFARWRDASLALRGA